MTSCHSTRTLHTISHLLKGETINHALGPLAIPQDGQDNLCALIGVNHNVHPETAANTLKVLQERGIQNYGPSVAFCGINLPLSKVPLEIMEEKAYYLFSGLRELVVLDEVAPPPFTTMASFLLPNKEPITILLSPLDFMVEKQLGELNLSHLAVPNSKEDILRANTAVINGSDLAKISYIAMTIALGLFTRDFASRPDAFDFFNKKINRDFLRSCFTKAYKSLINGNLLEILNNYIRATN